MYLSDLDQYLLPNLFPLSSSLLQYVFNYHDGDVFGCVADIGWITGHSYIVYGPLCNGGTTVLFESTPVYPNPGDNRLLRFFTTCTSTCLQLKSELTIPL